MTRRDGQMPAAHGVPDPGVDYPADFGSMPPLGLTEYLTAGGIAVTRTAAPFEPAQLAAITRQVDERSAVLLPAISAALRRAGEPAPGPDGGSATVIIGEPSGDAPEEERSRR